MYLSMLPAAMLFAMVVTPAVAQSRVAQEAPEEPQLPVPSEQAPLRSTETDRTLDTSADKFGQRQTREQVAPNVPPLARINSRINGRVQNRISNRLDRAYNTTPNPTDPFANAEQNQRHGARPDR